MCLLCLFWHSWPFETRCEKIAISQKLRIYFSWRRLRLRKLQHVDLLPQVKTLFQNYRGQSSATTEDGGGGGKGSAKVADADAGTAQGSKAMPACETSEHYESMKEWTSSSVTQD